MEKKLRIAVSAMFLLLFGAFIAALKIVDVRAIGPAGTSVGLATLNGWTHTVLNKVVTTLLGSAEIFDKISDLSILAAAAVAGSFGLVGLIQLIRRKSLFRVSREVIGLGVAYLLAGIVYLAFEMYVVNYRPVLEAGELFPEASFPSSHTVLAFVVFATAAVAWGRLLENHSVVARLLQTCAVLLLIVAVGARMLSGVHWLTDIVGAVIIGLAITSIYSALVTE